jgi:RNA polymerase sigma-70 factor (ECF subfamily)
MTSDIDNHSTVLSDEELMQQSLSNPQAFATLIARYKGLFFRYLKSFSGLRDDEIEDVVQISFIKIYRNLKAFRTDLKFSSWAYRIIHNEAVDEIKRRRRQGSENELDLDLPDKISLVDQLDEKLERKKVLAVLKKMSPDYREILTLYFFEGQSYQEISDILRRPLGTVCTQINRAKKQFKELYQKYVR